MSRTLLLSLALVLLACSSSEGDSQTTAETTSDASTESSESESDGDPVCLANGGVYGPCSEALCQCVQGGDLYQYCTQSCTETSECGDPADFPGAMPSCEPLNPGDPNMNCVLRCNTDANCPCGLECQSTFLICSEPQ